MKKRKVFLSVILCAVLSLLLVIPAAAEFLTLDVNVYCDPRVVYTAGDITAVSLQGGSLPPGMSWNWQEGDTAITVSGTPTESGNFSATFSVVQNSDPNHTVGVDITVHAPAPTPTPEPTPTPHTHVFGGNWQHDDAQHWHLCECGEKGDVSAHALSAWNEIKPATEQEAGQRQRACSVCGAVFEETIPVLDHTHSFDAAWAGDDTAHWHECACGEKRDVTEHAVPDNGWSTVREPTATAEGEKWGKCSVCGRVCTAKIPIPALPRITKNPTAETLDAGGRAIFIARADDAESCKWRFVDKNGKVVEHTAAGNYFPGLTVSGGGTETLTISSVPQALDGWYAVCCFTNQSGETLSEKALITVRKAAVKAAIITQQPKDASLRSGEGAVLSVRAISPDGGTLRYQWYRSDKGTTGSSTPIPGATSTTYLPVELEGDTYYCVGVTNVVDGVSAAVTYSNLVTVSYGDAAAPSPTPGATPSPAPHTHAFDEQWHSDMTGHFHMCECGEKSAYEGHDYEWTVIRKASRKADGEREGVCKVCGYKLTQPITTSGGTGERSKVILELLGALAVLVIAVAALLILKVTGKLTIVRDDEDGEDEEYDEEEYEEDED